MGEREFWRGTTLRMLDKLVRRKAEVERRKDWRAGVLAAVSANIWGDRCEPGDFFPSLKGNDEDRAMSPEETEALFATLFPPTEPT